MGDLAFGAYMRKGDIGRASQVEIGAIASMLGFVMMSKLPLLT